MTAAKKTASDFDEIIQKGRRQKNQDLANQLLGNGRRASAVGASQGPRKPGTGPSLASRVGVAKRSVSHNSLTGKRNQQKPAIKPAGNVDADWTHDLHDSTEPATDRNAKVNNRPMRGSGADREDRLYKVLNGSASSPALKNQFNIVGKAKSTNGISIRGIAGPSIVMADNFAPGTSAADIESAMTPIGGPILKCTTVTSGSKVIAELVFETREGADNVIAQFHEQIADGRVLNLYHKPGPVLAGNPPRDTDTTQVAPPLGPRADMGRSENPRLSARYETSDRYQPRERGRERRRSLERDDVVDGTYGFEEPMDTDEPEGSRSDAGQSQGLYSDNLVNRRGDRGDRGRWQDNRNRGRGGERGRDRGRGYR